MYFTNDAVKISTNELFIIFNILFKYIINSLNNYKTYTWMFLLLYYIRHIISKYENVLKFSFRQLNLFFGSSDNILKLISHF